MLKSGGGVGGGGGNGGLSSWAGMKRPFEKLSVGSFLSTRWTAAHASGCSKHARGSIAFQPPCREERQNRDVSNAFAVGVAWRGLV